MNDLREPKRLSCGVVVLRITADGSLLLMLRSFAHWDFPKGMQEAGESPMETALREVCEETTIDDLSFPWGFNSIDTGPYSNRKTARYFVGRTEFSDIELPVNPLLGRAEHEDWRWVNKDQALTLASPRLRRVIDWLEDEVPELFA